MRCHLTILAGIHVDAKFFGSSPGFVYRKQSDPGFVNPVGSSPGFINPVRSDPIRSDPSFVNARDMSCFSPLAQKQDGMQEDWVTHMQRKLSI